MAFTLQPTTLDDFDRAALRVVTASSPRPIDEVWEEVSGAEPLRWCRMLRGVRWTSPAPHGVGTTRVASLGPGLNIHERYIEWTEEPELRRNAFTVVSSPFPGVERFGERYEVRATPSGTVLRWEFLIEPRRGPLAPLLRAIGAFVVWRMQADTTRHFARGGRSFRPAEPSA